MKNIWLGVVALMAVGAANAAWVVDTTAKTLTDEAAGWAFTCTFNSKNITLSTCTTHPADGVLDLTDVSTDANGYKVTGFAASADLFKGRSDYPVSLTAPDVTSIGTGQIFRENTALESISFPNWTTSSGRGVFYQCTSLKNVSVPLLRGICDTDGSNFGVFEGCTALETISLPACTDLGTRAFGGCTALTTVELTEDVKYLRASAFEGCTSLVNFTPRVLSNATTIGNGVFKNCTKLAGSFSLPAVTSLAHTFYNCYELESVSAPWVTSFGHSVFANCTNLVSVDVSSGKTFNGHGGGSNLPVFYNCESLTELDLPAVTMLNYYSFSGCKRLKKITGCQELTEIAGEAMRDFSSLEEFPPCPKLVSLGANAFQNVNKLKTFVAGDELTKVGSRAFFGASALESFTGGTNIVSLGNEAFYNCSMLTNITPTVYPKILDKGGLGYYLFYGATKVTGDWEFPNYTGEINSEKTTDYLFNNTAVTSIKFPKANAIKCNFCQQCKSLTNCWVGANAPEGFTGLYLKDLVYCDNGGFFYNCTNIGNLYFDCPALKPGGITAPRNWNNMSSLSNMVFKTAFSVPAGNGFNGFVKGARIEFWDAAYPTFGENSFGILKDNLKPPLTKIYAMTPEAVAAWTEQSKIQKCVDRFNAWKADAACAADMPPRTIGAVNTRGSGGGDSCWALLINGCAPAGTVLTVM